MLCYFGKQDENWRIGDDVRRFVSFRKWNLLVDLYPLGRFDIVLCRHVLIHTDQQTKIAISQKLSRSLVDDGALYVGARKAVTGVSGSFAPANPDLSIYAVRREGRPVSQSMALAH